LGICFGHQILGMVYGASIARQKEDRSWQEIEIIQDSELFENFGKTVLMVEDHCESISVPPHFNLLASSDACVNEAMQHQEKKMFGVQFHPEVSGDNGEKIITNFIDILKKSKP
jgi:GMP synthase (glutamine-hydrolysing)